MEEESASQDHPDKWASPAYVSLVFAGYAAQFLLVYIAVFAWQLFAGGAGMSEMRGGWWAGPIFQIINGLWIGCLGFLLGLIVQSSIRTAARTGRWIWVPLLLLLLYGFFSDYFKFNWHKVVNEFFFWSNPGRDEGPLARELITYPAWSCMWYSVGVQVITRWKRPTPDDPV